MSLSVCLDTVSEIVTVVKQIDIEVDKPRIVCWNEDS